LFRSILKLESIVSDFVQPSILRHSPKFEDAMNHEITISKAREIADCVLGPAARQNDKEGRFSTEAVDALG
jgi:hypothetical protein